MRRTLAAVVMALLLTGATTEALGPRELAERAELVVRVRVTSAVGEWVPTSTRPRVVTFHEARVLEVVAGELGAGEHARGAVRVGVLGGAVGDIEQRVHGAPRLVVDREYVLFLGHAGGPGGARGVVGMWQGAWDAGPELRPASARALGEALDVVREVRP